MPEVFASGNMSRLMAEGRGRISSFWILVALIVGILIMGDLTRRMSDARRMEREAQILTTRVTELETLNSDLESKIATAGDDASIEAWARSEAKLIQEGERLVIPVPLDESSPAVAQPPPAPLEPPTPWEVWLALLGGG